MIKSIRLFVIYALAFSCAFLILASASPIPLSGWAYDTAIGEQLAGIFGLTLFGILAFFGLLAVIHSRQWLLCVLILPVAVLIFAGPERVSLDGGVLNSYLRAEAFVEISKGRKSQEAVAEIERQFRVATNVEALRDEYPAFSGEGHILSPQTYAITTIDSRWQVDGLKQVWDSINAPKADFRDIPKLSARIAALHEQNRNNENCRLWVTEGTGGGAGST